MSIRIQKYQKKYLLPFKRLIVGLQVYVAGIDPLNRLRKFKDFDSEAYLEELFGRLKKYKGEIFLALDGGKIVGMIVGIIKKNECHDLLEGHPSKDGHVLELFVDEKYRSKNIGKMLMDRMESYFVKFNCAAVFIECFGLNKKAYKFYKRLGYGEWIYVFIKSLKSRVRKL